MARQKQSEDNRPGEGRLVDRATGELEEQRIKYYAHERKRNRQGANRQLPEDSQMRRPSAINVYHPSFLKTLN